MSETTGKKRVFNYNGDINKSILEIVKNVLCYVEDNDLPLDHHFYIEFATKFPGVEIVDEFGTRDHKLFAMYPESMKIIIQKSFRDLKVTKENFSVVLSFSGQLKTLIIPFAAFKSFCDPFADFIAYFKPGFDIEEDDEQVSMLNYRDFEEMEYDDEDDILRLIGDCNYSLYRSAKDKKVVFLDDYR